MPKLHYLVRLVSTVDNNHQTSLGMRREAKMSLHF